MKNYLVKNLLFLSAFLMCAFASAQTVTGVVFDADGPLPGASVVVKGTTQGTETDFDGAFTLENVASDAVLVISYVGYKSQEVAANFDSPINISLEGDDNVLEQVVVMGYVQQTRGDITGSVASVDVAEATKVPIANAAEALQGRVSGVTINTNADPGAAPKINIRGFGTLNGTDPLFIIDGIQTTDANIFNAINPSDISQMNVIKDGAAALYGARAANGVVIVTTKTGSFNQDKADLNVNIYAGASVLASKPELMNAQQHGAMLWQSYLNSGVTPNHPQYGSGSSPVIPGQLLNVPVEADVNPNGTDWIDAVTQTAPTLNVDASLSNGNENGRYTVSFNYFEREGILNHTGFTRGSIAMGSDFRIGDKVQIGFKSTTTYSNNQGGNGEAWENAQRMSPLTPVYDNEGNFAGTYSGGSGLGNTRNPVAQLYRAKDNYNKSLRVLGNAYVQVEILEGLKFKSNFGGNAQVFGGRYFNALDPEHSEPLSVNTLTEQDQYKYEWVWTNTLNYSKQIENHKFDILLGYESLQTHFRGKSVGRNDYLFEDPDYYQLSNGAGVPFVNWSSETTSALASVFANVNYDFGGKYNLTASIRRDETSEFVGDNKSDIFPSFSAGWTISNESFFPEDGFISNLKLKGSWGKLGNSLVPNPVIDIFSQDEVLSFYALNGSSINPGARLSNKGNPDLKWETSVTSNLGLNMGFFDDSLFFSLEVWQILTEDMIQQDFSLFNDQAVDASAPAVNLGDFKNTGFDFSLGYRHTFDNGFRFGTNVIVSAYKNEVVALTGEGAFRVGAGFRNGTLTRTEVGGELSEFYGLEVTGLSDEGRLEYTDINGDGQINDDDRTKIGSPHPDFTYSLNLDLGFKGFDVAAFFTGSQGNDIYNYERIFTDLPTFINGNRSTRLVNAWTPSNTNTTVPALGTSIINSEGNPNSYFVEDGSYFRLKNLQVGYTFSSDLASKLGMTEIRIFAQGTNLFTITDFSGVDPEVAAYDNLTLGVYNRPYPMSKIYTGGINLKF